MRSIVSFIGLMVIATVVVLIIAALMNAVELLARLLENIA